MTAADEDAIVRTWPRGMNGMISYANSGQGSATYVRIRKIGFAWEVIATESHARFDRAMYPKQRAISRFALTVELRGYREYRTFMDFLKSYVQVMWTAEKKSVLVTSAVRNFSRWGVPVKGIADGDHIGSNVFAPTIVFESISDPLDTTIYTPDKGMMSTFNYNGASGDEAQFFYPFSAASQNAGVKPETFYDFSQRPNGEINSNPWDHAGADGTGAAGLGSGGFGSGGSF